MLTNNKITRIGMGVGFLALMLFALKTLVSGNKLLPLMMAAGCTALAVVLALGRKYWLIVPIALFSGLGNIPFMGRNIHAGEIAVLAVAPIYYIRKALVEAKIPKQKNRSSACVLLHVIWLVILLVMNPVGFGMLGASTMGARFYITAFLAAVSFQLLISQSATEAETKRIILCGFIISIISPILLYMEMRQGTPTTYYSWHQGMAYPATLVMYYAAARFRKISSRYLFLILLSLGIILLSGKRASAMVSITAIVLAPLLLHRQFMSGITRGLGILCIGMLILFCQGRVLSLPLTVQRSLSILPAKWSPKIEKIQGGDRFRYEIRQIAYREIAKRPFLGRKGYSINYGEIMQSTSLSLGSSYQFAGHALTGNWHSMWLALWVDLGLLPVLLYGFFLIYSFINARKTFQMSPEGSWQQLLSGILFLRLCEIILRSYTSGHSANSLLGVWWMSAMLTAIQRNITTTANENRDRDDNNAKLDQDHLCEG